MTSIKEHPTLKLNKNRPRLHTFGVVGVSLEIREEGKRELPDARMPGLSVDGMHPHAVLQ